LLSRNDKIVLLTVGILCLAGVPLGIMHCLRGDASGYAYPPYWMIMIFTWDDAATWGLFLLAWCVILWRKNDSVFVGLFFWAMYMGRSFIEILYDLITQFSPPSPATRSWEAGLPTIATYLHLKLVEFYVVGQVCWTMLWVTSSILLLTYIKKYLRKA